MLYGQLGYYFAAQSLQWRLKKEMRERLLSQTPDSFLETVFLSGNEDKVEWEEVGKEFFFQGQMFDVVRTKKEKGRTFLLCINDKKEEELLRKMNDVTSTNHTGNAKNNKQLSFKFAYDFLVVNDAPIVLINENYNQFFGEYLSEPVTVDISIIAPPPKV